MKKLFFTLTFVIASIGICTASTTEVSEEVLRSIDFVEVKTPEETSKELIQKNTDEEKVEEKVEETNEDE